MHELVENESRDLRHFTALRLATVWPPGSNALGPEDKPEEEGPACRHFVAWRCVSEAVEPYVLA